MNIEHRAILALRAFLVVLFGVLLVFQFLSLPGQFSHMADEDPDLAHLQWPLTAITVFWVLCVQVVLVCTWRLLTLVQQDTIFTEDAMPWVNAIVVAIGAGWVTLVGLWLYVGFTADDPGAPMLLSLLVVGVAVVGLLMIVMRALLQRATSLRSDLEGVI